MPDNWGFVAAAYAVTAGILAGYWRMLVRKERALISPRTGTGAGAGGTEAGVRNDHESRRRHPSEPAHPRPEPGKRPSLQ